MILYDNRKNPKPQEAFTPPRNYISSIINKFTPILGNPRSRVVTSLAMRTEAQINASVPTAPNPADLLRRRQTQLFPKLTQHGIFAKQLILCTESARASTKSPKPSTTNSSPRPLSSSLSSKHDRARWRQMRFRSWSRPHEREIHRQAENPVRDRDR